MSDESSAALDSQGPASDPAVLRGEVRTDPPTRFGGCFDRTGTGSSAGSPRTTSAGRRSVAAARDASGSERAANHLGEHWRSDRFSASVFVLLAGGQRLNSDVVLLGALQFSAVPPLRVATWSGLRPPPTVGRNKLCAVPAARQPDAVHGLPPELRGACSGLQLRNGVRNKFPIRHGVPGGRGSCRATLPP